VTALACFLWGVAGFVVSMCITAVFIEIGTPRSEDSQTEHERWCDCLCDRCEPLPAHIDGLEGGNG